MTGWIRTDYHLPLHAARFRLGRRAVEESELLAKSLDCLDDNPAALAELLGGFVESMRPELAGVQVVGVNFDFATMEWNILCVHHTLPPLASGAMLKAVPLIPEADAPHVVAR